MMNFKQRSVFLAQSIALHFVTFGPFGANMAKRPWSSVDEPSTFYCLRAEYYVQRSSFVPMARTDLYSLIGATDFQSEFDRLVREAHASQGEMGNRGNAPPIGVLADQIASSLANFDETAYPNPALRRDQGVVPPNPNGALRHGGGRRRHLFHQVSFNPMVEVRTPTDPVDQAIMHRRYWWRHWQG